MTESETLIANIYIYIYTTTKTKSNDKRKRTNTEHYPRSWTMVQNEKH